MSENLISGYLKRADFDSYEDFVENFEVIVPENFNFAFDVVDYYGLWFGATIKETRKP